MQKQQKLPVLVVACLIIILVVLYPSWFWLTLLPVIYVLHSVLLTDHIYYQPASDYRWNPKGYKSYPATINNGELILPEELDRKDTVLLKIKVTASLSGRWFDPNVEVSTTDRSYQQYVERDCNGCRYINLTPAFETGGKLKISANHCSLENEGSELLVFSRPDIRNSKVLIIAPHADDAEIAAFGLYKNTDSMVVTVSAGEAEPETFRQYQKDSQQNSQKTAILKGRVRAWDSVAIPKWAGLAEDRAIHLGYFCKHLKRMHDQPDQIISSDYAGISDTRVFRAFNSIKLESDSHGTSSWKQLVADLKEVIEQFEPDYIVTPHLIVDAHEDHHYCTLAVQEAAAQSEQITPEYLYYANHLTETDMHPYGPSGSLVSLPPVVNQDIELNGVFSFTLSDEDQQDKVFAIEMNHDLRRPVRFKKWLRKRLQKKLIGRYQPDFGEDEFFRKAVRVNELFFY